MHLSELKEKFIINYKKIIVVLCIIILVVLYNCINCTIGGKKVCRFATEFTSINVTEKDFDNIRGLYFLKKLTVDCYDTVCKHNISIKKSCSLWAGFIFFYINFLSSQNSHSSNVSSPLERKLLGR